MKSGYVVVVLACMVFISIPQFAACRSKPMLLAKGGGSASEDIARAQAELEQSVRRYQEEIARRERGGDWPAVAALTNELGVVYMHHGRHEQASELFQKALNIAWKIGDLDTRISALINLGLLSMETGNYETGVRSFEKVREISQGMSDPSLDAMVLHNLGLLYSRWGKPKESAEHYEKSIALRQEMGDKTWEAVTSLNLGEVYSHMGNQDKALEKFETARSILQRLGQDTKVKIALAGALTRLGMIYAAKGQYATAVTHLENCLALAKECTDLKAQADAVAMLMDISYFRGQYREAERHANDCLKLKKELNDQRGVASALSNLGILHSTAGEYNVATEYFQKALKVAEDVRDNTEISGARINLGTVCAERGQYDAAVTQFNQALELCEAGKDAKRAAVVHGNLGRLYQDQGRYDKATEHYLLAFSFYESQGMENDLAIVTLSLGRIREADGDSDGALEQYRKGLKMLEKLKVPTNWPNKLIGDVYLDMGQLDQAEQYLNRAQADSSLGRLCLLRSAYDRAKVFYRRVLEIGEKNRNADSLFTANTGLGLACEGMGQLEQAADYFRKATQYTEQLRSSLTRAERERFLDVKVGGFSRTTPYEGLARVLMKMNKPLDALNTSEYTKARAFAEAMAKRNERSDRSVPADVLKRDTLLNDQWARLTENLAAAYEKQNQDAISNLDAEKKDLNARLDTHIGELHKRYPLFAACRYPQLRDLSETALHDHEWVLSFDVTDLGVIVYLTNGKKLVKSLFKPVPRKEVDEMVRKYRQSFEDVTEDNLGDKLTAFDFAAGKQLCDLLLGDVLPDLPKDASVIVVPDDSLGVVPFEMLVLSDSGKITFGKLVPCTADAEFFGDRNPISYYQSITALTLARTLGKERKPGNRTLAMVNPVFSPDDARRGKVKRDERRLALVHAPTELMACYRAKNGFDFRPLPATARLGDALMKADPRRTEVYKDMDACKGNLFKKDLTVFRSIVFGTHGYGGNDLAEILEPVLVLTLVDQPTETYGFLRMSEVMGKLKLNADIVALTACQSGLGRHISGEGTMGMGRAFQYAGAKSVLMSLWSVAEKTSVDLVESFFKHLKEGKTKIEALRLARKEIRQAGFDHPFFWAPFILVGEVQ